MIEFDIDGTQLEGEIAALIRRYGALPKAVAKTHAAAALKRAAKDGIPILRRNTPPIGTRRGRRAKGVKGSTGLLRRAVTSKGKFIPSADNPKAYAVLGYRASHESRKAIWHEFGTKNGVRAKEMVQKTMDQYGGPAAASVARELAVGLEKAAKDKRMEIVAAKIAGSR